MNSDTFLQKLPEHFCGCPLNKGKIAFSGQKDKGSLDLCSPVGDHPVPLSTEHIVGKSVPMSYAPI